MADADSTATPAELAEQFPCTGRPFAVWYNQDAEDNRYWVVNDQEGNSNSEEDSKSVFEDFAAALKFAAKLYAESGWEAEARRQAQALAEVCGQSTTQPTPEQMKVAFDQIANLATGLQSLCNIEGGQQLACVLPLAVESIAAQIGWIADKCIGFGVKGSDGWFLPPSWEWEKSEAAHA